MLKQSFCHINSIGSTTEMKLWSNNIRDWDALNTAPEIPLSKAKIEFLIKELNESAIQLKNNNPIYFAQGLPSNQHWRIFNNFKSSAAYLDIETTGLTASTDIITTIAIYDGKEIKTYVNGKNLHDFKKDINNYKLLVTYNGKCFDIPFIEQYFNISLDHAHIDLRYVLHSLGYSGGLKGCEKQLGISRDDLEGVDGFFAIYLWEDYIQNRNEKALETLLAYNIEDVVNLEYLMHIAYNLKLQDTPFPNELQIEIPEKPDALFIPDLKTISKIKAEHYWGFSSSDDSEPQSGIWKLLRSLVSK